MSFDYQMIVIGAGSGGISVAEKASEFGAKVALIEFKKLGGTCVNVGCVPKKIMWNAAEIAATIQEAKYYGFEIKQENFTWQKLVTKRESYITNITNWYQDYIKNCKIDYFQGHAKLLDKHRVGVYKNNKLIKEITATTIVIATGSKPIIPKIDNANLGITSNGFFSLKKQPRKVAILGSGYIAVELAGVMRTLGSDVTLIARGFTLLRSFEAEIVEALEKEMLKSGIKIKYNCTVKSIFKNSLKKKSIDTNNKSLEDFDEVIYAIGREPMTQNIGLENVGLNTNKKGFLEVNHLYQTKIENIYAIGDTTGQMQLTPVAIRAGRYLARRLYNNEHDLIVDLSLIPTVVFSHPALATIGITINQAKSKFGENNVKVYRSKFIPMQHAFTTYGQKTIIILITANKEEKIVGLHLMGTAVDEIIQGFATAITMGATKEDFDKTIAIHPTIAEEIVTLK